MMRLCATRPAAAITNTNASRKTEDVLAREWGVWFILLIIGATSTKKLKNAKANYATSLAGCHLDQTLWLRYQPLLVSCPDPVCRAAQALPYAHFPARRHC